MQDQSREVWIARHWSDFWQDVRYALRTLVKNPGFTAVAVLTLSLAAGATTAIFSVVYGVLLKPLPYSDADRIVWMTESGPEVANRWVSYQNFVDWRARNQVFRAMSTFRGFYVNLTGSGVDDPDQNFYENYKCGSERNYTGYCNPELDKLFDEEKIQARYQDLAEVEKVNGEFYAACRNG